LLVFQGFSWRGGAAGSVRGRGGGSGASGGAAVRVWASEAGGPGEGTPPVGEGGKCLAGGGGLRLRAGEESLGEGGAFFFLASTERLGPVPRSPWVVLGPVGE
jgi:hypothetical protein